VRRAAVPPTIPAAAAAAARRFRDTPALIENGISWSFEQIYLDARAAASAFLLHGVARGDTVAIWAPNCREWILAAIGAQMAGAAIVPLNTRLKGREAGEILRRSHAKMLISAGTFLNTDYDALLRDESIPELGDRLFFDDNRASNWNEFVRTGRGADDSAVDSAVDALGPEDISDVLFTSGTTGSPKGVLSAHGLVLPMFMSWADTVDLRHGDRYLIVNPFFHTFGYKAGWVCCLMLGATMLPMPQFDVTQTAHLIERERVTFLPGPPTLFQSLLADRASRIWDSSSLRVAVTGGAAVPPILIERMQRELGLQTVITGYGMTECGAITMCRPGDSIDRISTTCGRAMPGLELRILGDGAELACDAAGEILVRGSGVMKGYLEDPQATAEAIDADGWLHTGDIGTLDSEGYLRITDRKKDIYITGGFNCYPAEIEALLCIHPAIEVAAVIGIPDERLGEVGKAFVVSRPGQQITSATLIAWARDNMANYKVPREIEICRELPKNAAGKVLRTELRALERQRAKS
jgi:acyl-CoA synthetase (AMP-forming)/AMP-acid ligase II